MIDNVSHAVHDDAGDDVWTAGAIDDFDPYVTVLRLGQCASNVLSGVSANAVRASCSKA